MTNAAAATSNRPWPLIVAGLIACALLYFFISSLRSPRLFPDLGDDITAITITGAGNSLDLKRSSDGLWRIPGFGDAPADPVKVTDLIQNLQNAERGPDKTTDPALYDSIGLGKSATTLQLRSRNGGILVNLLLGIRNEADGIGRFARLADDAQSFVLEGFDTVSSNGMMWTNAKPPQLDSNRLTQITLIEPSMQRMVLERRDADVWSRTDVKVTNEAKATMLADSIANLKADELRSAASINWFNAHIWLADSQDGLQLSLQAKRDGAMVWVRLNAAARQDADQKVIAEATQINNLRQIAFAVSGDVANVLTSTATAFLLAR